MTTGGSLLQAVDEMEEFACKVVKVVVIVDRLQGAAEKCADLGIPFQALLTIRDLGL